MYIIYTYLVPVYNYIYSIGTCHVSCGCCRSLQALSTLYTNEPSRFLCYSDEKNLRTQSNGHAPTEKMRNLPNLYICTTTESPSTPSSFE